MVELTARTVLVDVSPTYRVPAESAQMPLGLENCACVPKPSARPAAPARPASADTAPASVTRTTVCVPQLATKSAPLTKTMARGVEIMALLETSVVTSPAPRKSADEALAVGVADADTDGERVADADADGEGVAEADTDGERVAEADTDGERVAEPETDTEAEALAATLGDSAEPDAVCDNDGVKLGVGDGETEVEAASDGEGDTLGEGDTDGVGVCPIQP